jgi:hypothetical protein
MSTVSKVCIAGAGPQTVELLVASAWVATGGSIALQAAAVAHAPLDARCTVLPTRHSWMPRQHASMFTLAIRAFLRRCRSTRRSAGGYHASGCACRTPRTRGSR